ncbi:hypothetical protein BPLS_P3884 [Bathymodiolus platifrons methanotrophic gill symbiont]|uniref:hypothetical protein n=1 Tax=Bathymodiolus platifrons methanotrophic gill symbiont TaxID=113268 RepID=UPI001B57D0B5|nr:hypothetical protein [Bathymodiolus platifrons methanotrophic gill symbiont]GFO76230.1 hypothetical protein BPLS_P3884 [Bathymodiolus platifrons methanotrophic gill symbiont]
MQMINFTQYKSEFAPFISKPVPDRIEWLFIICFTVLLTSLLHANAFEGYWRSDDGFHLMFATEYSPWQYFFDPIITRTQSGANVTPWNALFYDMNLSIFGFNPGNFYAHLLLITMGTALSLFALLRLWLPLPSVILGVTLFLTGRPTYHLTQKLMNNHYLTGMLFSLLSLYLFTHYVRYGKHFKLALAVILYALAMTCKEVYVPLIGLFLVLPAGNFKQRLLAMLPFVLIVIGYAFWRHKVLGSWVGGYVTSSSDIDFINTLKQLSNLAFLLFDQYNWGLVAIIIIAIMSLVTAFNRLINLPLLIVSLIVVVVPLLPLTVYPGINYADRYLFTLWTAVCIWVAIVFKPATQNTISSYFSRNSTVIRSLLVLIVATASFKGLQDEKRHKQGDFQKSEAMYHFALESDFSQKALILDANEDGNYWVFVGTEARRAYDISKLQTPATALIFINKINSLLLLEEIVEAEQIDLADIQFLQYQNGNFKPIDISPVINDALASINEGKDQILQITLSQEQGVLRWLFEPKGIHYSATLWREKPGRIQRSIVDIPYQGAFPINVDDKPQIQLTATSPGNWVANTPKFKIESGSQKLVWQGKTNFNLVSGRLESLLSRLGNNAYP